MNRKVNIALGIIIALCSIVAIFVLFAGAIQGSQGYSETGNVFETMFGNTDAELNPVPWLIVAFVFECVGAVTGLTAGIFTGKISSAFYFLTLILLAAAGILFLNTTKLYYAVNAYPGPDTFSLGAGPITTAVFAFIGALLALYGGYSNAKSR